MNILDLMNSPKNYELRQNVMKMISNVSGRDFEEIKELQDDEILKSLQNLIDNLVKT